MINLQVYQQFGRIGIENIPYEFNLKIKQADFEVKQYPARIELTPAASSLEIDYTAFRESLGYRGINAQAVFFSQDAKRTWEQGVARRTKEGEEMRDLSKKISIAQIAEQATNPKERDLQLVGLEPIRIHFSTRDLEWKVDVGGVSTSFSPADIRSEFKNGKVNVYLEKEPYIEFKAVGLSLDLQS